MLEDRCSNCGDVLVDGKSFCANCGTPASPGSAGGTIAAPEVDAASTPKNRAFWRGWVVVGVAALVVLGAAGVGVAVMAQNRAAEQAAREKTERVEALREVYEAFVKVESTTAVGVTYKDYGPRVQDAAGALAVYEAPDKQAAQVVLHLAKALDSYKLANDAWATKFEKYDALAFEDFKESHPDVVAYTADSAIQDCWSDAGDELAAAKKSLDDYSKPSAK